ATSGQVAAAAAGGPQVIGTGHLPPDAGTRPGMRVGSALVPIRFQDDAHARGVLQIEQDYEATADGIGDAVGRIALVLGLALVCIYTALFPILLTASRRLRMQAADNERLALHDALTGLPNRTLFRDRVSQALLAARRGGPAPAVMLMDLDRFKEINDTLGHQAGDRVLEEVARRLSGALRGSDTIARLGGDEFAVLLGGVDDADAAAHVAGVVLDVFEEPVHVQDMALTVEASVGIALWPEHGEDVDALIRCADVAMYQAKAARSGFALYSPEGEEGARDRLALAGELRHAPALGQIEVHYQPKACLRTGRVTGVEALARWRHPRLGLLGPDAFIGMAEQSGAIRRLTLHVLDQALLQCRAWRDEGFPVGVAVNLSAHHLLDRDLPDDVAAALSRAGVEPGLLELEITESTVMANPLRAREVLQALREMGVRIAIDDFGVGHSSLGQLAELPVQVIKIDRSFVAEMRPDSRAGLIVRSTVDLGRSLGLEVVAEGVETEETWQELGRLGCDVAQGYVVSRPVEAGEVTGIILRRGLRAPDTRTRTDRARSRFRRPDRPVGVAGGPRSR
ncbi:MAG: EAL domain-containing protein, partial [Actinomycetota bacterium]